jgi:hypothetical protein
MVRKKTMLTITDTVERILYNKITDYRTEG